MDATASKEAWEEAGISRKSSQAGQAGTRYSPKGPVDKRKTAEEIPEEEWRRKKKHLQSNFQAIMVWALPGQQIRCLGVM